MIKSAEELNLEAKLKKFEASVLLTDDKFIQELNKTHRGFDKPTNVLSFPYMQFDEGEFIDSDFSHSIGDIIISFETIFRESTEQSKNFANHLSHMIIHSFLHLTGFDHEEESEAEKMEALEVKILSTLNIENPYE